MLSRFRGFLASRQSSAAPAGVVLPGIDCIVSEDVRIDTRWTPDGVTGQFLENAEVYHERYFNSAYWKYLLERGLKAAGFVAAEQTSILDIGSGSGNTALVLARALPAARVHASDISPQLLKILMRVARREGVTNLEAWCFDLHREFFVPASFDLVVGGAILHHMLDPLAALTNVAAWMRPGAPLIVVEPMEVGAHLMCALYQSILDEVGEKLDPRMDGLLRRLLQDYQARFGVPRQKPWTAGLDDKWMMSKAYLREIAGTLGLRLEAILPISDETTTQFRNALRGVMRASGNAELPTPERLWEIVDEFDREIGPGLKRRFAHEAVIVMRR